MPDYTGKLFPSDSRGLFERLIRRNRPLIVRSFNTQGWPWVHYKFRTRGRLHYHSLAVDPGTWVRVRARRS